VVAAPGVNVLNFVTGAGANTLTVSGNATLNASTTGTLAVTVNTAAVVNLADSQTYNSLTINGTARSICWPTAIGSSHRRPDHGRGRWIEPC